MKSKSLLITFVLYTFFTQAEQIENFNTQDHKNSTNIISWIKNNKCITTSFSVFLFYSCIACQIYRANLIINDPNSWSNWRNSRSIEDVFAAPQSKLESDLLYAVKNRYTDPTKQNDFLYSLEQSAISLHAEVKIVKDQIFRYTWLESCQCLPLFFINIQELMALQEKHKKLLFIQQLFNSWQETYSINKNK